MKNQRQIIWSEIRDEDRDGNKELFYVLAEQGPNAWSFFERSSWELRWYPITSTERLVRKALSEDRNPAREGRNKTWALRKTA
jgi:hypothetical protein